MTDVYDVANWRPVPRDKFIQHLGEATLTFDEPETLTTTVECLPDGRSRIVTHARLLVPGENDGPPTDEVGPYLMVLYQAERDEAHCFVRVYPHLAI